MQHRDAARRCPRIVVFPAFPTRPGPQYSSLEIELHRSRFYSRCQQNSYKKRKGSTFANAGNNATRSWVFTAEHVQCGAGICGLARATLAIGSKEETQMSRRTRASSSADPEHRAQRAKESPHSEVDAPDDRGRIYRSAHS